MKAPSVHRRTALSVALLAALGLLGLGPRASGLGAELAFAQSAPVLAPPAAPASVPQVPPAPVDTPVQSAGSVTTTPFLPPPPFSAPGSRDAHADRVVLMPTAYTHPRGTLYLSSYDLGVLQLGYAFSDRAQVSATVTPPLDGVLVPLDVTVKTAVTRQPHVKLALMASVSGFVADAPDSNFSGPLLLGRAGGVVQLCPQASCASSLSIASNLTFAGPVVVMANGVGAIVHLASWLELLLEVDTIMPLGREGGQLNGLMVAAGFRLPRASWGLDVALGRTDSSDLPYLPLFVLSYRR
jgi:hypothetical protein